MTTPISSLTDFHTVTNIAELQAEYARVRGKLAAVALEVERRITGDVAPNDASDGSLMRGLAYWQGREAYLVSAILKLAND